MTAIPVEFRRGSEGAVASYDATDIAEGTGTVSFYGFAVSGSAGLVYRLGRNQMYSHKVETLVTCTTADSTPIDIDFDTSAFNLPNLTVSSALTLVSSNPKSVLDCSSREIILLSILN